MEMLFAVLLIALVLGVSAVIVITLTRIYKGIKQVSFKLDETLFWMDNSSGQKDLEMLSLEMCKFCKGSGRLGILGNTRLVCETCEGIGKVMTDRASIWNGYYLSVKRSRR